MKKKILFGVFGLGFVLTASLAFASNSSHLFGANGENGDGEWHHYSSVKANETSNGCREYWIECGGNGPVFTDPGVSAIDGTPSQDFVNALESNDPRYTGYVPNAFNSEGNFWRYFRHGLWGTSDFSNGVVQIQSNVTINYKLIIDAHELGYKYIYFHAKAEAKEGETANSIALIAENTDGKFDSGNPWLQTSQPNGFTIPVDNFYGKYIGDETVENPTNFQLEVRNSANEKIEPSSLTFSNLKLFKSEAELKAFENLDTVCNTNGWDYFRFGELGNVANGYEFNFFNGDSSFTITKKLVDDMKAANCTTFSFNLKVKASNDADLRKLVYLSEFVGGINSNGETLSWQTDYDEMLAASKEELANTGMRITLNPSKLFGDHVTFAGDLAYRIQARINGQGDKYTCPDGEKIEFRVSDIIIK